MNKKDGILTIAFLSIVHAAVDFTCIFSLFHSYQSVAEAFLIYNFCAFALQMPFGILLDLFNSKSDHPEVVSSYFTIAGILFTALGAYVSPIVSGIGNALFHTGGGVISMKQDEKYGFKGRGLGVFVAPGAFGVLFGTLFAGSVFYQQILIAVTCILFIMALYLKINSGIMSFENAEKKRISTDSSKILLASLAAVILRSVCGMGVSFEWKQGVFYAVVSVACIACGKAAGGFLSAAIGKKKAVWISLCAAAACFALGKNPVCGLAALFFFNMTMPLTLSEAVHAVPDLPGFAFGILTFGLFIGYLPVAYGIYAKVPEWHGAFMSLATLLILLYAAHLSGKRS